MQSKKNNLIYSFLGGIEDNITDAHYVINKKTIENVVRNNLRWNILNLLLGIEDNLTYSLGIESLGIESLGIESLGIENNLIFLRNWRQYYWHY